MSDYRKLTRQPLVLVLTEIRYSPILNLKKYLPELQDKLRHDFPLINKQAEKSFQITDMGMEVSDVERWVFCSKNSDSFVDIDSERVVFATTQYDRFNGFKASVEEITKVIKEVINPSFFSRVGLRYCDAILATTEAELSKLLRPQLLASDAYDGLGKQFFNKQETLIQAKESHLVIRAVKVNTDFTVPEDLIQAPLKLPQSEFPSLRVILDIEHIWQNNQQQVDFDVESVLEKLENLHALSRKAFWTVTTEYARSKVWE